MTNSRFAELTAASGLLQDQPFPSLNPAYERVFQTDRLTLGLVAPIEAYDAISHPTMHSHAERAVLAEELGFSALWLRDVPFNVPSFGDVGQMFDPFVYLGYLAARTKRIGLGVASIILPLRHPAHVAKSMATADVLSGGRVLMGIASGDRPDEYPALNMSFPDRGARFRDAFEYIRALSGDFPLYRGPHGALDGQLDMLPKPVSSHVPMLITGGSRQDPHWVAEHGDGWITYPRDPLAQAREIALYRTRSLEAGLPIKPVMQSLYIDLVDDADAAPFPIHLGFRSGTGYLTSYLSEIRKAGVNHVALNLRFNGQAIETTLERLSQSVLPELSEQGAA